MNDIEKLESPSLDLLAAKMCLQSGEPNCDLYWDGQELSIKFYDKDETYAYHKRKEQWRVM